jgi:hypothetical protein
MRTLAGPGDPVRPCSLNRVIQNVNSYFEIIAKSISAIEIFSEAVETGDRVARQDNAKMANSIALVVILGRFYQDNGQAFVYDSNSLQRRIEFGTEKQTCDMGT